ncbi:MAG: DegT/DnrJ/EryC1/StrS family aminotransferase [Burkholderiales bacterium]
MMPEQQNRMRSYPRLPVLGWSAFSGERAAPTPGVLNALHRRYTTSGRAAIALALRALEIRPGDKVLVPTYHCPTMIAPVVQSGAQPMFYPITASGGVDLEWLRRAPLAGTRAMLAAHYFGIPQPMSRLRAFCDARRIALIEDCAHAFFGMSDGVAVGSWGDLAIASLPKFFPVPEGGLIASAARPLNGLAFAPCSWRDEVKAAANAIEIGAIHGRFPGLNALLRGAFGVKNWLRGDASAGASAVHGSKHAGLSVDTRLNSLRPAIVARWIMSSVCQSRIVENRRRNYAALASRLLRIDGARALYPDLPDGATPYVLPLYVDDPAASYQQLRSAGVPIFRWDEVWPGTPVLDGDHGLDWAYRVYQLGCHQDLSLPDIEAMATTVRASIRP